jgi:hypothetical protein
LSSSVERSGVQDLDDQRSIAVRKLGHTTQADGDGLRKGVSDLGFDQLERRMRRSIAQGEMGRQQLRAPRIVGFTPGLDALPDIASHDGNQNSTHFGCG